MPNVPSSWVNPITYNATDKAETPSTPRRKRWVDLDEENGCLVVEYMTRHVLRFPTTGRTGGTSIALGKAMEFLGNGQPGIDVSTIRLYTEGSD